MIGIIVIMNNINNKNVLITGTSTGIGYTTAIELARNGWNVIATMRNLAKAEPLQKALDKEKLNIRIEKLDVTDPETINECFKLFEKENLQLDALINNAGIGHMGTLENESIDDIRRVMETNFFGMLNVTKVAIPLLKKSKGNLLAISSILGIVTQPFLDAYCASKFAIEGFMESLAQMLKSKNVKVTLIEPGMVATDVATNAEVDIKELAKKFAGYDEEFKNLLNYMNDIKNSSSTMGVVQSTAEIAQTIIEVLNSKNPPLRVQTSELVKQRASIKLADLTGEAIFK